MVLGPFGPAFCIFLYFCGILYYGLCSGSLVVFSYSAVSFLYSLFSSLIFLVFSSCVFALGVFLCVSVFI